MTEPARLGKYSKTIRDMQITINHLSEIMESEIHKRDAEIERLTEALIDIRIIANEPGDRRALIDRIFGITTKALRAAEFSTAERK